MRKLLPLAAGAALLAAAPAALFAQWKTEDYTLKGGWNAIYLHGDASHATPAQLFSAYPSVLEVWRWNPNPDQVQYGETPATPDPSSSEWTIWVRDNPDEQKLSALIGQSAYLGRCSGAATTTTTVSIPQRPRPPAASWLVSGANFLGFPSDSSTPPLFNSYFASFPVAITTPSKIYKYIGGDLGATNPFQISTSSERVDRNTAYWFEAAVVGDFTAPLKYELPGTEGLAFGRTVSIITVGITNRTTSALTLTFSAQDSEPAPAGQTAITDTVPLTRRVYDSATATYSETAVSGDFTVSVPASGRVNVDFGIDRSQLTGSASALYASFLRVKDSARLSDVLLPVSAQRSTPAGLWTGQIDVSSVNSTVAGSPGSTTSRSFPLRVNLHVDAAGSARLLSPAFVGTLASTGNPVGVCTKEAGLLADKKSEALRLVSSQMPLDRAIAQNSGGAFAVGSTLGFTVTIPFDDPTNPFVHAYHPDHDNRDARLAPLADKAESYSITRTLAFTFTAIPPDGSNISGWGSTIYGGTYVETIRGLNKADLVVGGTFRLRRVSEIADITLN